MSDTRKTLKSLIAKDGWTHKGALYNLAFFGLIFGILCFTSINSISIVGARKAAIQASVNLIAPVFIVVRQPKGWLSALRPGYVNPRKTPEETVFADRFQMLIYGVLTAGGVGGALLLSAVGFAVASYFDPSFNEPWVCLGCGLGGTVICPVVYIKAKSVYNRLCADWERYQSEVEVKTG